MEERYSRVPVTQLKGQIGDGDMQAAKRDCNAAQESPESACLIPVLQLL